jgi:hypothetical protein
MRRFGVALGRLEELEPPTHTVTAAARAAAAAVSSGAAAANDAAVDAVHGAAEAIDARLVDTAARMCGVCGVCASCAAQAELAEAAAR